MKWFVKRMLIRSLPCSGHWHQYPTYTILSPSYSTILRFNGGRPAGGGGPPKFSVEIDSGKSILTADLIAFIDTVCTFSLGNQVWLQARFRQRSAWLTETSSDKTMIFPTGLTTVNRSEVNL